MPIRRFTAALLATLFAILPSTPLSAQTGERSEPILLCTYKLIYFEMDMSDNTTIEIWELTGCEVIGETVDAPE